MPPRPVNRIAFTLPDVGLREVKGLVYMDDDALVLKLHDALLGMLDDERKEIRIEPSALASVSIQRGLLRDRLVLRPKRPDLLDAVPGEHASAVELRVKRRHRGALEELVEAYEDAVFG
jgi:hypothetical protein